MRQHVVIHFIVMGSHTPQDWGQTFLHLQILESDFFVKIQHSSKQTILIGNIYLLLVLSGDSSYYRHVNRNQTARKVCLRRDLSKIHSFQTNIVQPGQLFFFFFLNGIVYSVTK